MKGGPATAAGVKDGAGPTVLAVNGMDLVAAASPGGIDVGSVTGDSVVVGCRGLG